MNVSREIERLSEHFADGPSIFTSSLLYQSLCKTIAQDQAVLEVCLPANRASYFMPLHECTCRGWYASTGILSG